LSRPLFAGSFTATYADAVEANGFYFVTSAGPPGADPVRWYAEASADNGSSWARVAASAMFFGRDGTPAFVPAPAAPPTERLWQVGPGRRRGQREGGVKGLGSRIAGTGEEGKREEEEVRGCLGVCGHFLARWRRSHPRALERTRLRLLILIVINYSP
jgi:hypothetical protein